MEIIISHDVDYITFWEHKTDLVIPKFVGRNLIEWGVGYVTLGEVGRRCAAFLKNKYQNTEEQMDFDRDQGIPSTFFLAVNQGRDSLNYSLKAAEKWITRIRDRGFDVGVHGIAFEGYDAIKKEYDLFKRIVGMNGFGCRIHFVRAKDETYELLNRAGYAFDSTVFGRMLDPYKIGNMWEFPLHVMDSFIMNYPKRWQSRTLDQAIDLTKGKIDSAVKAGIRYFNVLSHDIFFSDAYLTWKRWYMWLIEYFKQNRFAFASYRQAIQELHENHYRQPPQPALSPNLAEEGRGEPSV